MTEEVKIELSAEEQLAEVVKSEVAIVADTKANVESVEELKSSLVAANEAVELIKAEGVEALEAVKVELKAEMEAKFDSLPAIVDTKNEEVIPMNYSFDAEDHSAPQTKSFNIITKAELTQNNAGDAPVGNAAIYADLIASNPMRMVANVIPVSSASFKLPKLSGITANKNENAGSQSEAGSVADTTINVNHYNSRFDASVSLVEDLPGLDALVGRQQVMAIADTEHTDIISVLDAASITEQAFANAAAFDSISNWGDLAGQLPVQYWPNATWVMSLDAHTALRTANQGGTGSDLVFDASLGQFVLFGRPVMISSRMDAFGADANPVYFGDFSRGLLIGSRADITTRRVLDAVNLDGYTYYASMRSGQAVAESASLVRADQTA